MKNNSNDINISIPGEMGALIREKDWSCTPLGDPETWPQSLRTMVSVMLDNPFGMYIAWGPEYIQLYNDGYRPILGTSKHPAALGISTRETFAEIWHIIGPMFDGVMNGKAVGFPDFMLPLNRNGFVEKCYFDFSYSPIRKENGEVGGVLVTVIETTNKKIAEDDLKENKDQLQFAIESTELATWDFNPATNKFTSNHRIKEWFGLDDEHEIDLQQAINSIASIDQDRVTLEIQQSLQYASGGKLDIEFTVIHPASFQERILRAKGRAWYGDNKISYRLNGTVQDITEQAISRRKLEKSEEQLRIALEGGELGTFDYFPVEGKLLWSAKTKELFGLPPESAVNIDLYIHALHPDDRNTSQAIIQQKRILQNGGLYDLEYRTIGITDGRLRWVRSKGITTYDVNNNPIRYTGVVQDITERKEAEQALKESEARFRGMVDNISQLAWMAEADGNIFWYNKKWYEYTGTALDEMKGWGWQSVHDPELLPQVLLKFHEAIENVRPFEMIFPLKGADGKYRQFLTRMLPFMNREGKIYQWFGTNTDITERMDAEEASKVSEERFRSLANDMAAFVFTGDAETNVEFVNSQWLQFVGLKSEEGIGKAWTTVTHPDDVVLMTTIYSDAVANQKPYEFEIRQQNSSGVYCWVLWKGVPRISKEGKFGGMIGVGIDITDRKKAEDALNNQQAETEKLQRLYEAVTGNTPDLVYIFDLNYRFTYANPALLTMWGKPWEEAIGKNLLQNGYEPWHAAMHEREIDEIVVSKKPIRGTVSFPHAELGKRVYDYIFAPVLNTDGHVEAVAGTTRDITDIRNAEEELLKSEQLMRNMVETAPFPIGVYFGKEMKVQFANQSILDIWGKGNDVIGKSFKQILPELDNQEIFKQLDSVYTTGVPYHAKNQQIDIVTGGETKSFYFNYSFTPLTDTNGKVYGVMNTAADVTDLNLAKLVIQKSEKNLRSTILQAPVAMCIFKGDNFIVELANDRMFELWGKPANEVMNKPIFEGLPEAKDQGFEAILEGVYTSGKTFSADGVPITLPRNGDIELVYLNFVYEPYRNTDGIISGILAVAVDVTAQLTASKKIEEREQKFKLLADSMPQFIWTGDANGNLNYFNQSVYNYSGLKEEELKRKGGWLEIVHPDEREENINQWLHSVSTGTDFKFEHRFRRSDGQYRWQLSRAKPQLDENGNIQMWVGSSTDIQDQKVFAESLESEVRERTKELAQNNIELEKMNKELQSFAYISSHDLQEPLRKIQTFASRIAEKEKDNLSETGKDLFKRMQASAARMQSLIEDLLAYSRTNTLERDFKKINLSSVIEIVLSDLKEEILQKHANIEINKSCEVNIIPFQFQQLFYNLISNSLKFSNPEHPLHIKINSEYSTGSKLDNKNLQSDTNYCHITFADNGIGFEPQYNVKVFELFQRLHGRNEYNGTGIGLSIVKKIVENHDGFITAKGELDKGATFDIYLPLERK